MSAVVKYDGRRANVLEAEMLRRAEAVFGEDGGDTETGSLARAIFTVAARLEEEVTKRLDQAPAKQAANFYTIAGIGRDPAGPAALPVAFKLVDGAAALSAGAATQLMASGAEPVVFETDARIDLVPGKVAAMGGFDARQDAISKPSAAVVEAGLPRRAIVARRLLGGAAAGATKVQVEPSAGLKPGALLSLGDGDATREYRAAAVDGNLVTIDPPLETSLERDTPVREIAEFAPFAGTTRDHQSHALYLGHSRLLDLPSEATILVSGARLPPETQWSWWGKLTDDDDPAWQELPLDGPLTKESGKLVKTKINGRESLWLRAKLPDRSSGSILVRDVRLAVGGKLCGMDPSQRCAEIAPGEVGFVAIANTTPVVTNSPFPPFGREPRLYDSFYLGSDEAFAKAGAAITLCFEIAGADLGALVWQHDSNTLFGVGTDGLLYSLKLTPEGQATTATLQSLPSPTNDQGIVRLRPRSPIDHESRLGHVAAVAADGLSIYVGIPPAMGWARLPVLAGPITSVAFRKADSTLFALNHEGTLYQWDRLADGAQPTSLRERVRHLFPVATGDAVFLVIEDEDPDKLELLLDQRSGLGPSGEASIEDIPQTQLTVFEGVPGQVYFIAGYDKREQEPQYRLRLVAATVTGNTITLEPFDPRATFDEPLPVAFSPGAKVTINGIDFQLPTLIVATEKPTRISWKEQSGQLEPERTIDDQSIGSSSNPERRIYLTPNYEVVPASGVGARFRTLQAAGGGPPGEWSLAGPARASNPALSWEYWNGESWWALASRIDDFDDQTAHFTLSGGVFFNVPKDIASTEVAGKTSYWIRARLVGGDYGEAEVKQSEPGVFKRDTSTIRAPTIIQLKLGYCALEPTLPEFVLTEDNLGFIDQTSANQAGLEFPVFTSVAELMNPPSVAESVARRADETISCDDPCPEPPEDAPDPCEAAGAYDSCDSPCVAPEGYRRPASAGEAEGFVRGIVIGFDRPFSGQTISLYVDAKPAGLSTELIAEILQGGRFVRANVVADSSLGLTEPGFLTLAFPGAPDQGELVGNSAHWLRLRPKNDAERWSPVLRGVHLNAAMTHSVESHAMERLGASVAIEGQEFRLAGSPVLFDGNKRIEIRVQESVGEEERADENLDIANYPLGPAGDWVRWEPVDDLRESASPKRQFAIDANAGIITFGDGRSGLIPPLGADVLAVAYKRVFGTIANGIKPGTQVPLLSPLAGVDRVYALDYSAGGSDVETIDSARDRAAAKLRHDRRILTAADLEEHARTLSPRIAQVRLETRGGGSRLIIALCGEEAQPSRADLREFAAAIREVAGFGLARKGGLETVAPRLLPLALQLWLLPGRAADFAEAAKQAKDALTAFFDPGTGNHDGRGWPIGRLPDEQDIAAALTLTEPLAILTKVSIERADADVTGDRELPVGIPADVLVRLRWADIDVQREQEMAA